MATFPINIPDAQFQRVVDGVCGEHHYPATVLIGGVSTPNPETKQQFAKRMTTEQMKRWVKQWEGRAADKTAQDQAEIDISIT